MLIYLHVAVLNIDDSQKETGETECERISKDIHIPYAGLCLIRFKGLSSRSLSHRSGLVIRSHLNTDEASLAGLACYPAVFGQVDLLTIVSSLNLKQ